MRVQAGRAQVGSSVTAGSCWCSPASEAPGRRAGNPDPGWPGCHSYGLHDAHGLLLHSLRCGSPCCRGFFGGRLESRRLLHCLPCLSYLHHDLEEKHITVQTIFIGALTEQHIDIQKVHTLHGSTVLDLTHLIWAHWPVPCTQVEVWGASQGWRVWGCSWMSLDCGLFQSYQSGHGSGNTYWMYVLWWKAVQVSITSF